MKYRILIIRSQDILTDTRVLRYENWFKKNKISYKILGWDRNNKKLVRENTDYYRVYSGFNLGVGAIKHRLKWNLFLIKYLTKHRNEYDIIHACDFDTVWAAIIMKLFGKKVIFDIFDWFSDEVHTGKFLIDSGINFFEKLATKLADMTILCEEGRLKQIDIIPKRYIVIPNIPTYQLIGECIDEDKRNKTKIRIAYVGGLYEDRGLVELLEVVKLLADFELHIAGFGDENIVNKAKLFSESYSNIKFYGKVEYRTALKIMREADILYAMYYKVNRNNIFAAPNKFYESLFLKKPIVTTAGTLVGEKVIEHQTGYVIEEGVEALQTFLLNLKKSDLKSCAQQLSYYNENYRDCFETCMALYAENIKSI